MRVIKHENITWAELRRLFDSYNWRQGPVASHLGISPNLLWKRMKDLGIDYRKEKVAANKDLKVFRAKELKRGLEKAGSVRRYAKLLNRDVRGVWKEITRIGLKKQSVTETPVPVRLSENSLTLLRKKLDIIKSAYDLDSSVAEAVRVATDTFSTFSPDRLAKYIFKFRARQWKLHPVLRGRTRGMKLKKKNKRG